METIASYGILVLPFLVGPILALVGLIMLKWPPKKINIIYGYRTNSSMKNQDRWKFSQIYSAKEVIKAGILLFASSAIGLFFTLSENYSTILGIALVLFFIAIAIIRTELAVRKKFN